MTDRSIVEAAARLRRHGEPYVVATVVAIRGTALRRPGARLLLTRFRWVAGAVTGGCLEGDLAHAAWADTRVTPVVRSFDGHAQIEDEDVRSAFGLGGDGIVDVLVERAGLPGRLDALEVATRCIATQRRGAIATVIRGAGLRAGARLALIAGGGLEAEVDRLPAPLASTLAADLRLTLETAATATRTYDTPLGPVEVLIEAVIPPPRLFVFGTGHDAVPVVQLGKQLGWDVIVVAPEPRHATRERFANADEVLLGTAPELLGRIDASDRAVALVMHHDADRDRAALGLLLPTRVRYVGVLGPRTRASHLLAELGRTADARVHAPAGLELGAESPQELALAIAAELQSALREPAALVPREPPPERPQVTRASGGFASIASL